MLVDVAVAEWIKNIVFQSWSERDTFTVGVCRRKKKTAICWGDTMKEERGKCGMFVNTHE